MPAMTSQAEQIAAGLTDRGRAAVIAMDSNDPPVLRLSDELELGIAGLLAYETEREFYLNSIGQQVRAILTAQGESK